MIVSILSFAACNVPEYKKLKGLGTYNGLDAKTELKIIKWKLGGNYNGQKSVDEFYLDYIGVYNGYVLYYDWNGGRIINEVDGLLFSSRANIIAWKDGEIYSLQELYDNELLSRAILEKIHLRHQEISFPCYGKYNGYQVFVYRGGWGFESYSCVLAWKDGESYALQELYDNNYLTKNDLEEIELKNQWQYSYRVYDESNWYYGLGFYYGIYNDYVVYNMAGDSIEVIIDGLKFDEKVKVFIDGEEYSILDAYDSGVLTRANLEEIYLQHNEFCSRLY